MAPQNTKAYIKVVTALRETNTESLHESIVGKSCKKVYWVTGTEFDVGMTTRSTKKAKTIKGKAIKHSTVHQSQHRRVWDEILPPE